MVDAGPRTDVKLAGSAMGIMRLIGGKSASGSDRRGAPEAPAPSDSSSNGPDATVNFADQDGAEEKTNVAPPMHLLESEILGRAHADRGQGPSVPMPPSRPAHAPDVDADTFFEDAGEIERALSHFPEGDADEQSYHSSARRTASQVNGGWDAGPFQAPKLNPADLGMSPQELRAQMPQPLAPPLPPAQPYPMPAPGDLSGQFQAVPYPYPYPTRAPTVTGQYPVTGSFPMPAPGDLSGQFQAVPYPTRATLSGQYAVTGSFPMPGAFPTYTGQIPYMLQPVVAGPTAGSRWTIAIVFALIITTVAGVALGWLMFARKPHPDDVAARAASAPASAGRPVEAAEPSHVARPATAEPPPAAPPAAATPAPAAAAAVTPPAAAAKAESLAADIARLEHPPIARVVAPSRGDITTSRISTPRAVHRGDELFEVRRRRTASGNKKELAARVAELERLAKEDPLYEEFLADARSDYKRAQQGGSVWTKIKAPSDGFATASVGRGARVSQGQALAVISNQRVWTAHATVRGPAVTREWSCAIASPDGGSRAVCRIDHVTPTGDGTEVVASVEASQAPWLRRADQKPRLLLDPPRGP